MLLVFTGEGKGKTTAALGQCLRAVGQGKKVIFLQFIKSKKWPTGEEKAVRMLGKRFKLVQGGKGFVGILGDKLPREVHVKAAKDLLRKAMRIVTNVQCDVLVLDEANVALGLGLIKLKDLENLIHRGLPRMDIIVTGRGAPQQLLDKADLATECLEIKHPFNKGIIGKRGREY